MAHEERLSLSSRDAQRLCLALILAVGFVLRLYDLGVPSQWMDEILVTQNAGRPWAYIWELSRRIEVHSPLYYALVKGMLALGADDFFPRLPSALAGGCAVWLAWRLGRELFGPGEGLLAAAFTALNTHHLLLSRFVRPYALVGALFALAMLAALRASRTGRTRHMALLALACAPMLLLQYLALLPACALLGWLALDRLLFKGRARWRDMLWCAALLGGVAGLEWRFFLSSSDIAGEFLAQSHGLATSLGVLGECLARNLFYDHAPWLWWGLGAAALAGLALMWRNAPREALFVSAMVLGLPGALLAAGKVWNLWPRHLSPVIVPLCLCLAYAGARLARTPGRSVLLAALLAVAGLVVCLGPARWRFYGEASTTDRVLGDGYKTMARQVRAALTPGDAFVVTNDYLRNALAWYGDRLPPPNLLRAQDISPGREALTLRVLANLHLGGLAADKASLERLMAPALVTPLAENVHLYETIVARAPRLPLDPSGAFVAAPMDLLGFHRHVARLKDAVYAHDSRGGFAMASRNNTVGLAQWEFVAPPGAAPGGAAVFLAYRNTGEDNHIVLETAFDNEPPALHAVSLGVDPRPGFGVFLERRAPFERLRVAVKLVCAPRTPLFPGANLETLRLEGVQAAYVPAGDVEGGRARLARLAAGRALEGFLDERFARQGAVEQRIVSLDGEISDAQDPAHPGWNFFSCRPGTARATLVVDMAPGVEQLVAFPRVGAASLMAFHQVGPDGRREELLRLERPGEGITPVSARYPLRLDPSLRVDGKARVEIVLQGPLAQLWTRGGTIFFAR